MVKKQADVQMSEFARSIMEQKYSHTLKDGSKETWENIAYRVSKHVMKAVNAPKELIDQIRQMIVERKFMPGGRYLYASGRPFHQVQNCLLLRAEDSREGWADLMHKATMALMTGAGIGIDYSDIRAEGKIIRKTGGHATGPIALMQMVNEAGRGIMQGGARRSAIWAGLNWKHADIHKFITLKDWIPEVRELKEKNFDFPATMDGTNISVLLDDEFFEAFHNDKHTLHAHAHSVYWATVEQMLTTAEPGFSVDTGANSGETLRNAPVTGETMVLTDSGYRAVGDMLGTNVTVWTGKQWASNVVFAETNPAANITKVEFTGGRTIRCDDSHPFFVERYTGKGRRRKLTEIVKVPASELTSGDILHVSLPKVTNVTLDADYYALGYTYGDGSFTQAGGADITFCTEESKRAVGVVSESSRLSSINHHDGRGYTRAYMSVDHEYFDGREKSIFPAEVYSATASEQASFIAGLFDADGNYDATQNRVRLSNNSPTFLRGVGQVMEQLGILAGVARNGNSTYGQKQTYSLNVMADYISEFAKIIPTQRLEVAAHESYRTSPIMVDVVSRDGIDAVFCADVKVVEHSFMAEGVIISNCTEVTSRDDSDICNLGSINLARIESVEEMEKVVNLATAFLLAGTLYSDVPYAQVDKIRTKNRRLGLGLMGIHEWLLLHGKKYGKDAELKKYLEIYATSTDVAAKWAKEWEISAPVKTRAIAPTGTIGIVAETTTGLEPIFCAAYKRRYKKGATMTAYQYVLDPTAKKLVETGVNPDNIEDAYTLAEDVERRVAFQAWVQEYVDHSISSTINLPSWGSEFNNAGRVQKFGNMLIKYLPNLRGITCYPDGARGGQPLTPVKYTTASKHIGEVFVEQMDVCDLTKAGSCGS